MLKKTFIIISFFIYFSSLCFTASTVQNSQLVFMGARATALGGLNPTITRDLQSVFVNPASIADINNFQLAGSNKNVYGVIDGLMFNSCISVFDFTIGASVGYQMLGGIGKTVRENDRVRETGDAYSAGQRIYQLSVAKAFKQILPKWDLMVGLNGKLYDQVIDQDLRYGFGFDAGVIAITDFYQDDVIKKLYFGLSMINFYGTNLTWAKYNETSTLGNNIIFGVGCDILNRDINLSVFNNIDNRFTYALEYRLPYNIAVRGSSDFNTFNCGVGIAFYRVYGFMNNFINLKFDYAYTQNPYPMSQEATHTFSIGVF